MRTFPPKKQVLILVLAHVIAMGLLVSGCNGSLATAPAVTDEPATTALPSDTPLPPTPTPTPVPLALVVNGDGIPLAEYEAGMVQIAAAAQTVGEALTAEQQRQRVLDDLVDTALLARAARDAGYTVDDAALQAGLDEIVAGLGSQAAFDDWLSRMGYTAESFRSALRRSMEAAWQREQIVAAVPERAEQVHARQILVLTEAAARQVIQRLGQAGANFATLAFGYDLSTGGDLGWFPRGYLTQPAVEEAAFALQPGETSEIIATDFGYHILQVIARENDRPLDPEVRQALGRKALQAWLDEQRQSAQVEVLVP